MQETATHPIAIVDGEAVFAGSDVPLRELFCHLQRGYNLSRFADEYPALSREQVARAVRRMERLLKDSAAEIDDAFIEELWADAEEKRMSRTEAIQALLSRREVCTKGYATATTLNGNTYTAQHPEPLITRHPRIVSGAAVFVGTRIPVWVFIGNLDADASMDDIHANYPTLMHGHAFQAFRLAEELLAKDAGG